MVNWQNWLQVPSGTVFLTDDGRIGVRWVSNDQRIRFAGKYSICGETIVMVSENGSEYIAPRHRTGVIQDLEANGFQRDDNLTTPFCNCTRFLNGMMQDRWEMMQNQALNNATKAEQIRTQLQTAFANNGVS